MSKIIFPAGSLVINSGTTVTALDATLNASTIDISGIGSAATVGFIGDAAITLANPSVDATSLIASLTPGQTAAGTTVMNMVGEFVNQGTILANGPAGSTFTLNIVQSGTGTAAAPGYTINSGTITANTGNTLTINIGPEAELFNTGLIVANGGTVRIAADPSAIAGGYAPARGYAIIERGGTLETNSSYASTLSGTYPLYVFSDSAPGNTLKIDNIGSFSGRISGLSPGNTIDLGTSLAVGTVVFNQATQILNLESNAGTILASLLLGTGAFASGTYAVQSGAADGFVIGTNASGDTILTTNLPALPTTSGTSGTWQSAASWVNGVVPGALDTPIIGPNLTFDDFTLTTGNLPVSVNSFTIGDPNATVKITSNTTATPNGVSASFGTLEVTTGYTLTASSLSTTEQTAAITIDSGSTIRLLGHPNSNLSTVAGTLAVTQGNTYAATFSAGAVVINGALLAGPPTAAGGGGSTTIGYDSNTSATVTVNSGGTVTDTYALLGSDPTSFGSLILNGAGASWSDQVDAADTLYTRGYMAVGYNNLSSNTPSGVTPPVSVAPAQVLVENGATLTDTRGYIAYSPNSSGLVTVMSGGVWNIGMATGGYLNVAQSGPGALSILAGGTVNVGSTGTFVTNGTTSTGGGIGVGYAAGSGGTIMVDGTGSVLKSLGGLAVGRVGQGILNVLNSGSVSVASGLIAGFTAGSSGTVVVSGVGASIINTATASSLIIGDAGVGNLSVQAGGYVRSLDNLDIGGTGSGPITTATGTVSLSGSSTMEVLNTYIWSGSTISVDATSSIDMGASGTYVAGAVDVEAGQVLFGEGLLAATIINNGAIRVSNNATLANSTGGKLEIQGSVSGTGGITIGAGATLQLDSVVSAGGGGQSFILSAGSPETLIIGAPGTAFANSLTGLATGDKIEFGNGMTITSAALVNGNTAAVSFHGSSGLAAAYNLSNVGFAAGSPQSFSVGMDAISGDSYIQVSAMPSSSDTYSWIGTSGDLWSSGANWADATIPKVPAGSQPGAQTPVVIAGPTGSTFEVITGGGTAASIVQTGLVDLLGTYAIGGTLSIGTPETVSVTTSTSGSLTLGTGSVITDGAIALNSGTIALAGTGASLTTSGSVTVGLASGYVLPNGTLYAYESGSAGLLSIGAGASFVASGGVAVTSGSLVASGTAASVSVGSLSLGTAATETFLPSTPYYYGDGGRLSVSTGATVTVAGNIAGRDASVSVSGAGSRLTVGGTISLNGIPGYSINGPLQVTSGGSLQTSGLSFQQFGSNTAISSLYVDSTSVLEVGTLGGAAAGALTIDAGAMVSASVTTWLQTPTIIDNGVIVDAGGSLSLYGAISGSGSIVVGSNDLLQLYGTVASTNAISMAGTNVAIEIGASSTYNGSAYTYALYPVSAPISGFAVGDSVTFDNTVATRATYTATGVNLGTLALFNGTTQVAAVTLAGSYTGTNFFLSPTTSGAETVSILPSSTGGGSPLSTNNHTYSWIGTSGGLWSSGANWADATIPKVPAGSQPGAQTPVVIAGPTGSTFEVITGGGTAASIVQTGLVDLLGTYAIGGTLSIGTPETVSVTTSTSGSLTLGTGSVITVGAIALNSGTITLAGTGASLTTSGSVTVGLASGYVLPNGTLYASESGGAGVLSIGAGASFVALGGVAVTSGSLVASGTAASVSVGSLSLGTAPAGAFLFNQPTPYYFGDAGQLLVSAGASVSVAGNIAGPDASVSVSGAGSRLTVGGTMSLDEITGYTTYIAVQITSGGLLQTSGLSLQQFGSNTAISSLYVDSTSVLEVGTLGGAAAGALTIDAGAMVSASVTTWLQTPTIIDNGVIVDAGGSLSLYGAISGSGSIVVGSNDLLQLYGTVASTNAISMAGTNVAIEIGASSTYNGSAYTYALYPVSAPISGFAVGDSVTFDNTVATRATYTATGVNLGTLALFNGTTQVAAVTLAGSYTGTNFFLSPTTSGAETVSILPSSTGGGSPLSTNNHTYSWIGTSGGLWSSGANWADATIPKVPAGSQPGAQTPVVIAGPTGSTFEVITGGGTAASIVQTGLVDLLGTYAIGGTLSIGTPETVSVTTSTSGSLRLGTGSVITDGAIALNSGTIALAGTGASLTTNGSVTVGLALGYVLPNGTTYVNESGGAGLLSIGAGASFVALGGVAVTSGSLVASGTAASVSVGSLSLGTAPAGAFLFNQSTPYYFGDAGQLLVSAGASVSVAGNIVGPGSSIGVTGIGSRLTVGGTMSLNGSTGYSAYGADALQVLSGGSLQTSGLSFQQFGSNTTTPSVYMDSTSVLEVGTLGGAAAGALTIDAGATVSASVTTSLQAPTIINNGVIVDAGGVLSLYGTISGNGSIVVGSNDLLQLYGTVASTNAISMAGTNVAIEIGASSTYNGSAYTYALYPVSAPISGFAVGDSVTFDNTVATRATYTATGVNLGTLALFNGTTQVAAVTLAGSYTGTNFFLSPSTSGAESVSILPNTVPIVLSETNFGAFGAGSNVTQIAPLALSVNAAANAVVTVFDGSTIIGTGTANGIGVATINVGTLALGTHLLSSQSVLSGSTSVASASVSLTIAAAGQTNFTLGSGISKMLLGDGNDQISFGNTGNVTLRAGNGFDQISGGDATANLSLGSGGSRVLLGAGNDTVSIAGGSVFLIAGNGNDSVTAAGNAASIDNIYLGGGTDAVTIGDGAGNVTVGDGSDSITVGNGNDILQTGNGADTIVAGNGNDYIQAGNGNDRVTAGSGTSGIQLGNGNNTVNAGAGNDTILLGDGNNTVNLGTGTDYLRLGGGVNTVTGTGGAKTLDLHGSGTTTVTLSGGNELIYGTGTDTINAGGGNNIISMQGGVDTITAGDGNNTVQLTNASAANTVTLGNGTNKVILGTSGAVVTAGNGANYIEAFAGTNTITVGTNVGNVVKADSGSATITLGAGSGSGNGPSDKFILGSGGGNVTGGWGTNVDQLNGGAWFIAAVTGSDTVVLASTGAFAYVETFNTATDLLEVSSAAFGLGLGLTGSQTQAIGGLLSTATDGSFSSAGALFAYNASNGVVSFRANASSGSSAIADLANHPGSIAGLMLARA